MTAKKTLRAAFGAFGQRGKTKAKPGAADPVPAAEPVPAVPTVPTVPSAAGEPEPLKPAATRPGTCRTYRVTVGAST